MTKLELTPETWVAFAKEALDDEPLQYIHETPGDTPFGVLVRFDLFKLLADSRPDLIEPID